MAVLSVYRIALNGVASAACLVVGMSVRVNLWLLDVFLGLIDALGGKPEALKAHGQREDVAPEYVNEKENGKLFIDTARTLNKSSFVFTPEALIEKSKKIIKSNFGVSDPEVFSEDFQFIFPIVGPLSKEEFLTAFAAFKLGDAAPDKAENFFGFQVDPIEHNRVWALTRPTLTHTGPLNFFGTVVKPTGTRVIQTPQLVSFSFDREGRCYKFTGGYPVDRTIGNGGGLGGLFGILHAVGMKLPFPEGQPWRPSPQWMMGAYRLNTIKKEWKKMTGSTGPAF